MAYILGVGYFVFTCGIFSATLLSVCAQVYHREDCAPTKVAQCFENYRLALFTIIYTPDVEDEIRRQARPKTCSSVITNYTQQEKGYEAARSLICDEKAYMDYVIAKTCINPQEQGICQTHKMLSVPQSAGGFDMKALECRNWWAPAVCYEKALKQPCPVPKETAVKSIKRGYRAAVLLTGCDEPSESHASMPSPNGSDAPVVSLMTLILLVTVCLFLWSRA
ncbi:uncharacterized protein LOC144106322 isoform X2 [Amblyomma americanum]